jgi:PPP family 3-phenylpropionic acid transporter
MMNSIKIRLGLLYFSMFSFIGIHMPFWPVWLKSKGISPSGIAVLTALAFALKIVFTPIVSSIVDVSGKKREAIVVLAFGLFAGCMLFFLTDSFLAIFLLTTAAFACWSPIMSLAESLTTVNAKRHGLDYGKIRLWGSIAFMIIAMSSGKLLEQFGEPVLLWSICGAACLLFVSACILPKTNFEAPKAKKAGTSVFFKHKWFVYFLLATTLIQGSHAAYYTFGTIHWRSVGLSDQMIGILWGSSMAVEIAFFAFGRPILNRLGPINVIALGGVAAALRWFAVGVTGNFWLLLAAQCLHALSFGASHFAAIRIISENVDDSLSATGQGAYSAFIMGIGMGIFVLASGPMYSQFHQVVFYIMSGVSLAGTAFILAMKSMELQRISLTASSPSTDLRAAPIV